jgi:4-amino-4-deoxy-L-arabinose transferase-like glycosyltransferase
MAVESWDTAAPYIVATGQEVMPMGGFSGTVPEPTLAQVQALVRSGQLRFFLLDGTGAGGAGVAGFGLGGRGSAAATIVAWVESGACAAVPATDYQTTTGTGGGLGGPGPVGATLYECQRTA